MVPNPDKSLAFVVHAELQTKHGILNHENLIFDELIADKKYQFVYMLHPGPDQGRHGKQRLPDRDYVTRAHRRVGGRPAHATYSGLRCRSSRLMSVARTRAQHRNELLPGE